MNIEENKKKILDNNNNNNNNNLPWVEKYRPSNFDELISQKYIIETINKFMEENKLPHLLFYGPPGTGKTSTILAIARKLYGKNYSQMILELNASDDRGIEVVRQQIKDFANTKNIFNNGLKLIVLDEADSMTSIAQAALRRIIEKYTKTTRFCLICNYLNKIIPALQSRCTRFRFSPLQDEDILHRLNYIIQLENLNITEKGIEALIRLSEGDMRKVLNILQSASMSFERIDDIQIYSCVGHPLPSDISDIVHWMLNENFSTCYQKIQKLQNFKGLATQDILKEIHHYTLKLDLPTDLKIFLFNKFSEIEYRLSCGSSDKINLGAIIGTFQLIRDKIINK